MIRIRVLTTSGESFEKKFNEVLRRSEKGKAKVEKSVRAILRAVREEGDQALFALIEKYDQRKLDSTSVVVNPQEIEKAYQSLNREELHALSFAASRIEKFHRERMKKSSLNELKEGGEIIGEVTRPLGRVGLYIPGGKAAYPSSVLMSAIPACIAGVKEIVMTSPSASAQVLAAAKIAGVSQIYRMGGAQAIAALAYGTESIAKVDKIVGPGNVYVETAKRLVFGEVGLDMVAGPSEIVVIADESGNPSFAAADLLAQAEHDEDACSLLITFDEAFLKEVKREVLSQLKRLTRREIAEHSIRKRCAMILVKDINEAIELANRIAPEHLALMVMKPDEVLERISCAGAVLLGNYSPVTVGDYLAGPSHILPTAGTARFFSPLGVEDFMKRMSVISFSKEGLHTISKEAKTLALMEGFDAHAKAVEVREDSE